MSHPLCHSLATVLFLLFLSATSAFAEGHDSADSADEPPYGKITYAGIGDYYTVFYDDPADYILSGWGLIDASGRQVIPCVYDCPLQYDDSGYAIVCDGDSARIIDIEGNEIFSACGDDLNMVGSDESGVCYAILYGDDTPTQVIRLPVKKVVTLLPAGTGVHEAIAQNRIPAYRFFPDGYQRFGFYDLSGREVVPMGYFMVGPYSEGLASVIIRENGKFDRFNEADAYDSTVKVGFIDLDGNVVIQPVFFDEYAGESLPDREITAPRFENGRAIVDIGDYTYRYIDCTGKILDEEVLFFSGAHTGLKRIESSESFGLYGFTDASGRIVIPCRYPFALEFDNNYAIVHDPETDYYSLIDKSGNTVLKNIAKGWY